MQKDPSYPIGKYEPRAFAEDLKNQWLSDIRFLPQALESALSNLDEFQLHTPYREGGWTVHQLVHHIADSHINAYCRFKLGFSEDNPTIKTYEEKTWANTKDVHNLPVNISVTLLHALHQRWYEFLVNLSNSDWLRTIYHPEHKKQFTLWHLLGMYAWHSRHHVAHITALRDRLRWH
jgi:uncharacterized damage-inducible protein DinB